jgi:hypothetical protein
LKNNDVAEFLMIRIYHFIQLGILVELDDEIIWIYGFFKYIEKSLDLLIGLLELDTQLRKYTQKF